MPDDSSSSDQPSITDIYENDPYRKRRVTHQSKITWQVPSKLTLHSYLPYSDYSSQQQHQQQRQQQKTLSSTQRADSLASNGFYAEQQEQVPSSSLISAQQRQVIYKDNVRQDSLLTTITTTARTSSTLVASHPFLHSAATTLSLSEELRKQKYQDTTSGWRWVSMLLYPCCCGRRWRRRPSWRWLCFIGLFFLLGVGGILLFICFPRLPLVSMAQTADTYGQELAEWGPPQNPFYRTTWQLNLTLDNRPNFIPLHITQMDLVLRLHPTYPLNTTDATTATATISTSTTSSFSSEPATTTTTNNTTGATISSPLTDDILSSDSNHNITTLSVNQSHSILRPPPPPSTSTPVTSTLAEQQQQNGTLMNFNDTSVPFAWSTLPSMTLNTDGKHQVVNAIFHIDYAAPTSNLTDPTFAQLYKCGPHIITNPPALNVSLDITFHILDYLWTPTMTVYPSEGNGLICPAN